MVKKVNNSIMPIFFALCGTVFAPEPRFIEVIIGTSGYPIAVPVKPGFTPDEQWIIKMVNRGIPEAHRQDFELYPDREEKDLYYANFDLCMIVDKGKISVCLCPILIDQKNKKPILDYSEDIFDIVHPPADEILQQLLAEKHIGKQEIDDYRRRVCYSIPFSQSWNVLQKILGEQFCLRFVRKGSTGKTIYMKFGKKIIDIGREESFVDTIKSAKNAVLRDGIKFYHPNLEEVTMFRYEGIHGGISDLEMRLKNHQKERELLQKMETKRGTIISKYFLGDDASNTKLMEEVFELSDTSAAATTADEHPAAAAVGPNRPQPTTHQKRPEMMQQVPHTKPQEPVRAPIQPQQAPAQPKKPETKVTSNLDPNAQVFTPGSRVPVVPGLQVTPKENQPQPSAPQPKATAKKKAKGKK